MLGRLGLRRLGLRVGVAAAAGVAATATWLRGADDEYNSVPESALPTTYQPDQFAAVWSQHPRCAVSRLVHIAATSAPFGARVVADYVRSVVGGTASDAQARAAELRALLTQLGPTFIKLGQMLSIRPDLLPPDAVHELQKLCDGCPSYPTADALLLIERELGAPADELFDGLGASTPPVAAASLGQVYRCRLRSSGEEVALKVQRPDMIRAVSLDLYLLRGYMHVVEWLKTEVLVRTLGAASRTNFDIALLDAFATASFLELDYRNEAANLERFAAELVPRCGGKVYVPRCHGRVSARKVLATEWIVGEQLAKSPPEVIAELIPVGVDCFLVQLLSCGFFHSDPHPGNLLVDEKRRLVLIDFGLCAEIAAFDSRALTQSIVHLMQGDVEALVDDAVLLRFLPPTVDRAALLPQLKKIFEQARHRVTFFRPRHRAAALPRPRLSSATTSPRPQGRLAAAEQRTRRAPFGAVKERRAKFWAVSRDLNRIFFEFPFMVPDYFALITRALIVLEGIALTGDADFDLFRSAYPYAAKHAASVLGATGVATVTRAAAFSPAGAMLGLPAEEGAPPSAPLLGAEERLDPERALPASGPGSCVTSERRASDARL